ncbi:MAG: glycosyltransferase family 4 protein [Clostridia bacterium]|nr:glycosyltransferase family 4 protein [Clostridia bacterium]
MRLIIVSQHFYPDSFRVNDIAFALREQGHQVRVITGLPDYDTGMVPPAYRRFQKRREMIHGVEVIRLPTTRRRTGAFWRLINYASFAVEGWLYASFMGRVGTVDAVFTYQTSPVSQALPAIRLARRYRCPHLLYCLDLWPESMKVWGLGEGSLIYRVVSRISGRIYRATDLLAVCSRPFEQYLADTHGVDPARMHYLPQHCEALFDEVAGQYEENGVFDFVFAGNVGTAQDVPCILRAVALLGDTLNFHVHIVGAGSELEAVRALTAELGLEKKVTFHGRKPLEQMPGYYRLADAFLLTLAGDSFVGQTLPGKLQSYMSAGKPVVAAVDNAAAELLAEVGCGFCAPASDAKGLARCMAQAMVDIPQARAMGERGRTYYLKHFRREVFMEKLVELMVQGGHHHV